MGSHSAKQLGVCVARLCSHGTTQPNLVSILAGCARKYLQRARARQHQMQLFSGPTALAGCRNGCDLGGPIRRYRFHDRLPKRDTAKRQTLNGQGRQTAAPRKRGVAFPTCWCTVRVSPAPHNSIPLPLQDNSITLAPFWISPSTTPIHEPIHSFRICADGGGSTRLCITCCLSRALCHVHFASSERDSLHVRALI